MFIEINYIFQEKKREQQNLVNKADNVLSGIPKVRFTIKKADCTPLNRVNLFVLSLFQHLGTDTNVTPEPNFIAATGATTSAAALLMIGTEDFVSRHFFALKSKVII